MSSSSCVMSSMGRRSCVCNSNSSWRSCSRRRRSSAGEDSSSSSAAGSLTSARASAVVRWRWPPESGAGSGRPALAGGSALSTRRRARSRSRARRIDSRSAVQLATRRSRSREGLRQPRWRRRRCSGAPSGVGRGRSPGIRRRGGAPAARATRRHPNRTRPATAEPPGVTMPEIMQRLRLAGARGAVRHDALRIAGENARARGSRHAQLLAQRDFHMAVDTHYAHQQRAPAPGGRR